MQDLQMFRLRGEFETTVEVLEQAGIAGIADEFAGDALEVPDNFTGPVGRAIVQHHHPVGTKRLPRNGGQRLLDEGFVVEGRDRRNDFGCHGQAD